MSVGKIASVDIVICVNFHLTVGRILHFDLFVNADLLLLYRDYYLISKFKL